MKIYTLGPVEMFPATLKKSSEQIPYFRTPEFSEIVLDCERMIKDFAGAGDEDRVVLLTCSGTGAMEATVLNCLTKDDHVLVIDGGTFGHRFVEMCELHQIPHEVIHLDAEEAFSEEQLDKYQNENLTALLVNIDETSTGQLYPLEMLSDFCKKKGMYLIVDAISSFLVDSFNQRQSGVDITIVSSQKALALAPGLSIVIISERMLKDRIEKNTCPVMYFDFNDHLNNAKRGQTPFTPAVGIILQLHQRLQGIKEKGVQEEIDNIARIAMDFRERVRKSGLPVRLPDYPMSNACTTLIFDDGRAYEVHEILKNKYGLIVTPSGGTKKKHILRVGHLGNLTINDNIELIDAMKNVLGV